MTQELTKTEQIADEAVQFFDLVTSKGRTVNEIADNTGYSLRTVYNRINQGREIVNDEIRKMGPKILADLWRKYELIWNEAYEEWKASKDPAFLKQMQSVLDAYRKMMAVDAAPKAPVNEEGKVVPNSMILVFSEDAYAQKEAELKLEENKAIEGTFTVENSTTVLLTEDENAV